ncbi:unnamed protein product [Prunus brigantina]
MANLGDGKARRKSRLKLDEESHMSIKFLDHFGVLVDLSNSYICGLLLVKRILLIFSPWM